MHELPFGGRRVLMLFSAVKLRRNEGSGITQFRRNCTENRNITVIETAITPSTLGPLPRIWVKTVRLSVIFRIAFLDCASAHIYLKLRFMAVPP